MKRFLILGGFLMAASLIAPVAVAQSDSDYQGWMKSNAANMGSLNKNIAAKDGAGAASDAQKLEATFKQVAEFWTKRGGADDAVNFAMRGQTAAAAVAKAATAGNMDEAGAQVKNLQANCGGCHMAHREGTAGSFKIK
jgi:cytochrome c556